MGYVRMIKAGGLHFVSNSIRFVPDLDDIPSFEQLTIEEEVGGVGNKDTMASEAAKTLDEVVANLVKNFSDSTEYFQVRSFLFLVASTATSVVFLSHMRAAEKTKAYWSSSSFSSWSTSLASNFTRISTRT